MDYASGSQPKVILPEGMFGSVWRYFSFLLLGEGLLLVSRRHRPAMLLNIFTMHRTQDNPYRKESSHPELSIVLTVRNPGLYKWRQAIA